MINVLMLGMVFLWCGLFSEEPQSAVFQEYRCLSIPKSGTHLLQNVFYGLSLDFNLMPHPDNYGRDVGMIDSNPDCCFIFNIRDPRDCLVSLWDSTAKMPAIIDQQGGRWDYFVRALSQIPEWKHMTRDEQLLEMINMGPRNAIWGVVHVYHGFVIGLKVKNNANVHFTKFEDLVGLRGGGSLARQLSALQAILRVTGQTSTRDLSDVIDRVAVSKSATLNKGEIGRWKEYFNEHHKRAFKENYEWNRFLIEFGYEQNEDW